MPLGTSRADISILRSRSAYGRRGRCANKHVLPYIIVQVVGAVVASGALYLIASGRPDWVPGGFAANGYGALSPGKFAMPACFLAEFMLTFFFLLIIVGTTSKGAASGFAGIPIGLALTLIHLILDPDHQHLRQPGAQHRPRLVRRRRLYGAALAVLARAYPGRSGRRRRRPRLVGACGDYRDDRGRRAEHGLTILEAYCIRLGFLRVRCSRPLKAAPLRFSKATPGAANGFLVPFAERTACLS